MPLPQPVGGGCAALRPREVPGVLLELEIGDELLPAAHDQGHHLLEVLRHRDDLGDEEDHHHQRADGGISRPDQGEHAHRAAAVTPRNPMRAPTATHCVRRATASMASRRRVRASSMDSRMAGPAPLHRISRPWSGLLEISSIRSASRWPHSWSVSVSSLSRAARPTSQAGARAAGTRSTSHQETRDSTPPMTTAEATVENRKGMHQMPVPRRRALSRTRKTRSAISGSWWCAIPGMPPISRITRDRTSRSLRSSMVTAAIAWTSPSTTATTSCAPMSHRPKVVRTGSAGSGARRSPGRHRARPGGGRRPRGR